jgi:DNA uptake protein ComE-like DNA-binding protein
MVGPATAKKILKFRNSLGGFYSVEQLRELYGMKDSKIKKKYMPK